MPLPWMVFGGDDRDRTGDLRLAKPALYQLSYVPQSPCPRDTADGWEKFATEPRSQCIGG